MDRKERIKLVKQYQKADACGVCVACGNKVTGLAKGGCASDYCILCQARKKSYSTKPHPPLKTDAGFYFSTIGNLVRSYCPKDAVAYHHPKYDLIYVDLVKFSHLTEQDAINHIILTLSHEFYHFLLQRQGLSISSFMLDNPGFRAVLDRYYGRKPYGIYVNATPFDKDLYMKWVQSIKIPKMREYLEMVRNNHTKRQQELSDKRLAELRKILNR